MTFPAAALRLSASLVLFSSAVVAQSVVTVAGDGTATYSTVQEAIDDVGAGSTVVIREGSYSAPALIAKPIALVADRGAEVTLLGPSTVVVLDPDATVVLRGLDFRGGQLSGPAFPPQPVRALRVFGPGAVWAEDCSFVLQGVALFADVTTLEVVDAASVYLDRCTLVSGEGLGTVFLNEVVTADGSTVFASDCSFTVGDSAGPAQPAVRLVDSFGFFSGCTLVGGAGADGNITPPFDPFCATDGGPALELDATSTAVVRDSALVGGPPGLDVCDPSLATDGPAFVAPPGAVDEPPGLARSFRVEGEDGAGGSITGGESLTVTFEGDLFDLAVLRISATAEPDYVPELLGTLVSPVGVNRLFGVLTGPSTTSPASLSKTVTTQPLGASAPAVSAFLQGVFVTSSEVIAGPGSFVQLLPAGIVTPASP